MPNKRINRNVNENRIFRNEAYRCGIKFHKRGLRLYKDAVSGMAKEKGITNIEDGIRRLSHGESYRLTLLPDKIILIGAGNG